MLANRKFNGISGQTEMNSILQQYQYQSSSTCNSSLGFFHDVIQEGGKCFSAIVPHALNGGNENFEGEIKEITAEEAKRLVNTQYAK